MSLKVPFKVLLEYPWEIPCLKCQHECHPECNPECHPERHPDSHPGRHPECLGGCVVSGRPDLV